MVGDASKLPPKKYFSMGYYIEHPVSTGSVHITSTSPYDAPIFYEGYLTRDEDLELLVYGYKRSRELARRMPSYRGEVAVLHPQFREGSECKAKESQPVPIDAPDLVYTEEDERAVEKYTRDAVGTAWHSVRFFLLCNGLVLKLMNRWQLARQRRGRKGVWSIAN